MQNVSIYQSISTAFPYLIHYQLPVCLFEGVLRYLLIIELACENPKPKYNIQKFKHKRQKLKAESSNAKGKRQ